MGADGRALGSVTAFERVRRADQSVIATARARIARFAFFDFAVAAFRIAVIVIIRIAVGRATFIATNAFGNPGINALSGTRIGATDEFDGSGAIVFVAVFRARVYRIAGLARFDRPVSANRRAVKVVFRVASIRAAAVGVVALGDTIVAASDVAVDRRAGSPI